MSRVHRPQHSKSPGFSGIVIAFSLLMALVLLPSYASAWKGKVVAVSDGDTITVLNGKDTTKIRLYGVDAPELGQPFGRTAKRYLSHLVYRRVVDVESVTTDSYERQVALITLEDGSLVNQALLQAGLAWVYRRYCTQPRCLEWKRLEDEAQEARRGLWKEKNPLPPWEWRHEHAFEVH